MVHFKFGYTYKRGDEKKLCHRKLSAKCQHSFAPRTRARARGGAHAAHFGGKMKIGQKYDFWKKLFFRIFFRKIDFLVLRCTLRTAFLVYFPKIFWNEGGGLSPPPFDPPPVRPAARKKSVFFSKKNGHRICWKTDPLTPQILRIIFPHSQVIRTGVCSILDSY